MIHKHHNFWSLVSIVNLCIKYHLMYPVQRVVCTGSHTSGIGPHSSTRHDTGGRPWYRSHRGRIRLCRYSIQEDRRCWQILYMAFQQLWAKKTNKNRQQYIYFLIPHPPSKIKNFPRFSADLTVVAAAPLSTGGPACKFAGGSVTALIVAFLYEMQTEKN